MRGVIIWLCPKTHQAVIWCDDSGDLAYARNMDAWVAADPDASVGDYVAFDLSGTKTARICTRLRVVAAAHAPDLARILRDEPEPVVRPAPRLRACA